MRFKTWCQGLLETRVVNPGSRVHRGTLLIRSSTLLGPYGRTLPRVLWWPSGGGLGGGDVSYEQGTPVLDTRKDIPAKLFEKGLFFRFVAWRRQKVKHDPKYLTKKS